MFKKKEKKDQKPVGGVPFFISIICLLIFATSNVISLPQLFYNRAGIENFPIMLKNFFTFIGTAFISGLLSSFFLKGHIAVLIHETKHRIFANFVGNKYKEMVIGNGEGHVTYEYTKKTRMYNALIALAPYFFPLFTILILIFSCIFWWGNHTLIVTLAGIGYGADFYLGISDAGPHQSDFTGIEGGYKVGLIYVIAINIAISTTLMAWAFDGKDGLLFLCSGLVDIVLVIIELVKKYFDSIQTK